MARRSDFAQKLLDDLRLRKERMGLSPPGQRRSSASSSRTIPADYKNSQWSYRSSRETAAAAKNHSNRNVSDMETAAKMWFGNKSKAASGSQEIVPFGRGSGYRERSIDLSMALAMALRETGKLPNIEVLGRKIVLGGSMAYLSPSQMGEVAKGVRNLNMILRACSNGFNFNRGCIEIGRDLLKGAMDLEESLKMLMTVQDASDYMVGSRRKERVKLLKAKEEEEEELKTYQGNPRKAGSRTEFFFLRERRGAEAAEQKKKSTPDKSYSNSSKSSVQFISYCRSISGGGSSFGSEAPPAVSHGSHELVRFNLIENGASEKVRMPNIIAKLMGLEELPAPIEAKGIEMRRAPRSPQLKEMSNKPAKIDAQEKGMNNTAKSNLKNSLKLCVGDNGEMDANAVDRNDTRVRKKNLAAVREDNTARKQSTMDTFVQIESSVKITKSDHKQKGDVAISEAEHDHFGKKELSKIKGELVLKQQREAQVTAAAFSRSHNERDREQLQLEKKKVMKSKDREKHPDEVRTRTQSSKESFNSKKNDLVNKNGSQSKIDNLKTVPDGTNIRNRKSHNNNKRLPSKSDKKEEKMPTMRETVMRKPKQIQSVQKANILKVRKGDTNGGSSVEVTVQNKQVEGIYKGSDANQKLNKQQKNETISSVDLPEGNGNMEITICNPCTESSPLTRDVNIQASMEQPIKGKNVKSQKENSVYQLPERSSITMTECVDKCSQEDSTQKHKERECRFTENKEEDHGSKSIVYEDWKMKEVDEILTKDEDNLKKILITNQNFLNVAHALFQIKIPQGGLQATENRNPDKEARLLIDCGYELLSRKSKREELIFYREGPLAPLKSRNIDILIKEVNSDIENLKHRNYAEGREYDLADCLSKMIEKDIQQWHPDINCLWDFGWDSKEFVCLEKDEIVRDVEKHMLNGLLNELSRDLLNVSISIF